MQEVAKLFLKRRNWQPVELRSIDDYVSESYTLFGSSSSTVVAPGFHGEPGSVEAKAFPALKAHVLHAEGGIGGGKPMATAYSSGILLDGRILLPLHLLNDWERVRTDGGNLFNVSDGFCVGRIKPTKEIKEGILVGGAGAFNWYHFIIEVLPKAFLSQHLPSQFDDLPLLVPDECRQFASFSSALMLFSGGRPIHFVNTGDFVCLERLIVFDEFSIGPFNLVPGAWPTRGDYAQHDSFIRSFVDEFRLRMHQTSCAGAKSKPRDRRVFLTRPGTRRNYNQDELLEIASKYGFERFSPEECSLEEQARVFAESSTIVGPSGAAWVGIIFRELPLRGMTWLPREYRNFCGYSGLANLLGHQIDFIEAKTSRALRSTGEAYVADYKVCPIQFESALKRIFWNTHENSLS